MRHLQTADLAWFDLDPAWLVTLAAANEDRLPGLAERLATCHRAAWQCDSYLVLRVVFPGPGMDTVVLDDGDAEEFAIDLDRSGDPVGVEFLHRLPCRSDGASGRVRDLIGRLRSR